MKKLLILLISMMSSLVLVAQIPPLNHPGSVELEQGNVRFIRTGNPLFTWNLESPRNQLNLLNADQEEILEIDPFGNATFGDSLNLRFKLSLTSPGDGATTYTSGGTDPAAMLRLIEKQEDKFGRIHLNNEASDTYWQIQSRSGTGPEMRMYWSDLDDPNTIFDLPSHTIMSIQPGQVTVNGTTPRANMHIIQSSLGRQSVEGDYLNYEVGLGLEDYEQDAFWRILVVEDNLALMYNENHMGSFSSSSGFYNPSDLRLKESIEPLSPTLRKVMHLNPTSYRYKDQYPMGDRSYGFIAQEVQDQFPDLVKENKLDGMLMINYNQFIPILTKSIQELQTIIAEQQEQIYALQEKLKNF